MKRKALITATAVLLVAVMCLATASYAWFTAGDDVSIEGFKFGITQADSAVQLAAVNMKDLDTHGIYTNKLTNDSWGKGWSVQSDEFVPVSSADGATFFTVGEYNQEDETWTSNAQAGEGYLYFVFNIKAPAAGTATISFTTGTGDAADTFNSASKLAVKVGETTTIYDMAQDTQDSYKPMTSVGATCEKDEDGYFVPVADAATPDENGKYNSDFFDDGRSQTALKDVEVEFTAAGEQQVAVAYWVEGMDKDCSGNNWKLDNQTLDLEVNWAA